MNPYRNSALGSDSVKKEIDACNQSSHWITEFIVTQITCEDSEASEPIDKNARPAKTRCQNMGTWESVETMTEKPEKGLLQCSIHEMQREKNRLKQYAIVVRWLKARNSRTHTMLYEILLWKQHKILKAWIPAKFLNRVEWRFQPVATDSHGFSV